jgi:ABC-type antimicrobial peptide transport system permease subunit
MSVFSQIIGVVLGLFLIWFLYKSVQHHPERFSMANFSKSFRTVGLLGVALILFVYLLVLMVKH